MPGAGAGTGAGTGMAVACLKVTTCCSTVAVPNVTARPTMNQATAQVRWRMILVLRT